jgi:hypothetical protein
LDAPATFVDHQYAAQGPGFGANQIAIGDCTSRAAMMKSNPEMASLLFGLVDRVNSLETTVLDMSRWVSKRHWILSGSGVPNSSRNEDCTAIFINLAFRKWGVKLDPRDFAIVHRLGTSGLIAEVVNRKEHSAFWQLTNAQDQNPRLKIDLVMKSIDEDKCILQTAQQMLNSGQITKYYQDNLSGRVVIVKNGHHISIYNKQQIDNLSV